MTKPSAPLPAEFFSKREKKINGGSSIFYEGRLSKIRNGRFATLVPNFPFLRDVFKVTRYSVF